jgi:hypothetical protein
MTSMNLLRVSTPAEHVPVLTPDSRDPPIETQLSDTDADDGLTREADVEPGRSRGR